MAKLAILLSSLLAGAAGYVLLRFTRALAAATRGATSCFRIRRVSRASHCIELRTGPLALMARARLLGRRAQAQLLHQRPNAESLHNDAEYHHHVGDAHQQVAGHGLG